MWIKPGETSLRLTLLLLHSQFVNGLIVTKRNEDIPALKCTNAEQYVRQNAETKSLAVLYS